MTEPVVEVLETYSPDEKGEYVRLEKFQGIKSYVRYGSKDAAKARLIIWCGKLSLMDAPRPDVVPWTDPKIMVWTDDHVRYAKQQIDMALDELYQ